MVIHLSVHFDNTKLSAILGRRYSVLLHQVLVYHHDNIAQHQSICMVVTTSADHVQIVKYQINNFLTKSSTF